MSGDWERFLAEQFPACLLPHAARAAVTPEAARHFLRHFTRRGEALRLIGGVSLVSARAEELRRYAFQLLPDLIRGLPSRSEVEHRVHDGGFRGRLDLPRTLALHLAGQETRYAARERRRSFALPENLLVASITRRLLDLLEGMHGAGLFHADPASWGATGAEVLQQLRHLRRHTRLAEIPVEAVEGSHQRAARDARHPAYAAALALHQALDQAVERPDPEALAAQLARGALLPLREPRRYEIAVLLRLLQRLEAALVVAEPAAWTMEREVVLRGGRGPIARLRRADGGRVDVHYDRAPTRPGPRDEALRHYLSHQGRLRPDGLITLRLPGGARRALVVEVKCSTRQATLVQGLTEAFVYQQELRPLFPGGVVALAVGLRARLAAPRAGDDLILTDWAGLERLDPWRLLTGG